MIQNIKGLKESIVKSLFELYTRQFQKKQSQQTNTCLCSLGSVGNSSLCKNVSVGILEI